MTSLVVVVAAVDIAGIDTIVDVVVIVVVGVAGFDDVIVFTFRGRLCSGVVILGLEMLGSLRTDRKIDRSQRVATRALAPAASG